MITSSINVFGIPYSYKRASRYEGGYPALKTYLQMTGYMTDFESNTDEYPLQSPHYRYKRCIAVLIEQNNVYYCCTIVNGKKEGVYEVLACKDKLKEFFEANEGNLTVLENTIAAELPPTFDDMMKYVQHVKSFRDIVSKHADDINAYQAKLSEIREELEDIVKPNEETTCSQTLQLMDRFISTLDAIKSERMCLERSRARRCFIEDGNDHCRMFGLYLISLNSGLKKHRHLDIRTQRRPLNTVFRELLKEMHTFMQDHPNIEEDYGDYMQLKENERKNLHALLESEGLTENEWGYIGDEIF